MSKKHFEMVARILRETVIVDESRVPPTRYKDRVVIESYARAFAAEFAEENPRFDRARFLTACGVEETS